MGFLQKRIRSDIPQQFKQIVSTRAIMWHPAVWAMLRDLSVGGLVAFHEPRVVS